MILRNLRDLQMYSFYKLNILHNIFIILAKFAFAKIITTLAQSVDFVDLKSFCRLLVFC